MQSWGTLREALRDGQTQWRVDAAEVARPGVFGVGAATGLEGEITVSDGTVYLSTVTEDGKVATSASEDGPVGATMLFVASVPQWQAFEVREDVDPADVERFLAAEAAARGIDVQEPFPFRVEGELLHLHCHVMRGECPVRAQMLGQELSSPPFQAQEAKASGAIIGFHALNAGGQMTHHGQSLHAHALFELPTGLISAHAESFGIAQGAQVFLPVAP